MCSTRVGAIRRPPQRQSASARAGGGAVRRGKAGRGRGGTLAAEARWRSQPAATTALSAAAARRHVTAAAAVRHRNTAAAAGSHRCGDAARCTVSWRPPQARDSGGHAAVGRGGAVCGQRSPLPVGGRRSWLGGGNTNGNGVAHGRTGTVGDLEKGGAHCAVRDCGGQEPPLRGQTKLVPRSQLKYSQREQVECTII